MRRHLLPLVLQPDDRIRRRRNLVDAGSREPLLQDRNDLLTIDHRLFQRG